MVSHANRATIYQSQGGRCFYCERAMYTFRWHSKPLAPGMSRNLLPTCDHLEPRGKGGKDHGDNYVIACFECNRKRGMIPWILFKRYVRRFGIERAGPGLKRRREMLNHERAQDIENGAPRQRKRNNLSRKQRAALRRKERVIYKWQFYIAKVRE